jgi:Retrotransposon gag protein
MLPSFAMSLRSPQSNDSPSSMPHSATPLLTPPPLANYNNLQLHRMHAHPSVQSMLENIETQIRSLSDHLTHEIVLQSPDHCSSALSLNSCPPSPRLSCSASTNVLSQRLLQAQAEIHRLKLELASRTPVNNHHLYQSPFLDHRISKHTDPISSPHLTGHSTHSFVNPQSSSAYLCTSSFQPIDNTFPTMATSTPHHVLLQPHPLPSRVPPIPSVSVPPSHLPTLSMCVPAAPSTTSSTIPPQSNGTTAPQTNSAPLLSAFSNTMSIVPFTMPLPNNLPTFKGMDNERPMQFLNDFETRASALVGTNDSVLLQTVQQVLADGALTWFSQLQKTVDYVTTWENFKSRFFDRYRTPAKLQNLRSELRMFFQGDTESTSDYYERLKTLVTEIDPQYSENWFKYKFLQKLRSDIRSRLDLDTNSSLREMVRKAQSLESNIEQQKIDEKLKQAALKDKQNTSTITTNNLFARNNTHDSTYSHRSPHRPHNDLPSPSTQNDNRHRSYHRQQQFSPQSSPRHYHHHENNRSSPYAGNAHSQLDQPRSQNSPHHDGNRQYPTEEHRCFPPDHSHQPKPPIRSHHASNTSPNYTHHSSTGQTPRYWCPHCQRYGHSWERCSFNPYNVRYHERSSSNKTPSPSTYGSMSSSQAPPDPPSTFQHGSHRSENWTGR